MMDLHGNCFGKMTYPTKAKALEARDFTLRRQRKNYGHKGGKGGAKLIAYLCPTCHHWHLGGWAGPSEGRNDWHIRKRRGPRHVG